MAACPHTMNHHASTGPFLRIDEIWLSREPLDMRCGPETTLARVVEAFGAAKPHCAYVFANKRANRMKILICDGFGVWLLARRLHRGRFVWSALRSGEPVALDELQLQALASGLPWQYAGADFVIDRQ
ncbi:IS66 family insertion sequence element accessory protein TnpB [Congregibacter litoralis]|nr:IS66 family insertion sequence element accessory protein TnpB [Congregibacter litoralis]